MWATHILTMRFVFSASLIAAACLSQGAEPEPEVLAAPHTVEVSVRIQSLEALFRDLAQRRDAARLPAGPACAYDLARVLKQTPTVAPMRVIPFAALHAASRAGRVSALADSPDGATVDVTELPADARAKIILVSHRWWSSVNAQPDRVEHGWVRAALRSTALSMLVCLIYYCRLGHAAVPPQQRPTHIILFSHKTGTRVARSAFRL